MNNVCGLDVYKEISSKFYAEICSIPLDRVLQEITKTIAIPRIKIVAITQIIQVEFTIARNAIFAWSSIEEV